MAKKADAGSNQPPIIVRKIVMEAHAAHHGGAWKVAYADFVTAMMAFFLLLWLLGATDEEQRKGLADYFAPTLVEMRAKTAGSDGLFGGESLSDQDSYPHEATQTGTLSMTIPRDATGTRDDKGKKSVSTKKMDAEEFEKKLVEQLKNDPQKLDLLKNIRFTDTDEGLRIELIDEADFSMFALATDTLNPRAKILIGEVVQILNTVDNLLVIRGHTDSLPYASGKEMNNWLLSSARAEATRKEIVHQGVLNSRMARIEGVADTEPYNPENRMDDRNRRISITMKTD